MEQLVLALLRYGMRRKCHRKVHLAVLISLMSMGAMLTLYHATAAQKTPPVVVLDVADAISPGTSEYIAFGIEEATRRQAQLLVIRLDTPGGLVTSTRDIVKAIFGSGVPVAVYVAPGGARAASAGTFITMSAHIAAMAPGTNIGAASPVSGGGKQIQGDMRKKAMNDVAAFARAVASRTGRNIEWAESAVREAISVDEAEALKQKVIDLVAADVKSLLLAVHGKKIKLASGDTVTLSTKGAAQIVLERSWRQKVLTLLSDPNIAYILMLLGMYGLFFELSNPGSILPGGGGRHQPSPGSLRSQSLAGELCRSSLDGARHHHVSPGNQGGELWGAHHWRNHRHDARLGHAHRFPGPLPAD